MELEPEPELEPDLESEPEIALAFEQLTHPETEEVGEPPAMPVEQQVGREQLTRLRARYAELLTRISERGGDAERVEALRAQAESLNPDTWVTEEEVRQGVDAFEPKIRDLRAALGLRRRRRSRRGGRRRRGGGGESGAPPAAGPEDGGQG
jgi:ribonuclease E